MTDPDTTRNLLSVIIPVLDDFAVCESLLASLRTDDSLEIIVVDGGEDNDLTEMTDRYGARYLRSESGRGRQMNAGAEEAGGDFLFFLHADSVLPEGWAMTIRETLDCPGVAAGAFSLRLDAHGFAYRLLERAINTRSRFLALPYGDQGQFMTAETFDAVGGFWEEPLMEDVEILRRLKRVGRVVTLPDAITTSARRWRRDGLFRHQCLNLVCIALYRLGAAPATIARLYGR